MSPHKTKQRFQMLVAWKKKVMQIASFKSQFSSRKCYMFSPETEIFTIMETAFSNLFI